jgi:hypothetical protein
MRSPDQTSAAQVRRHWREESRAHLSKSALLLLCASLLWIVIGLGTDPVDAAVRPSEVDHGTQTHTLQSTTTTSINGTTAVRGHKEGTLAVVFSFIGVIAVIVLIVFLGSISVRRRTRDNPTQVRRPWGRGPPDSRRGWFG